MPAPTFNDSPHRRRSRVQASDAAGLDGRGLTAGARMVLDQHRSVAGECVRGCGPWPCGAATEATTAASR